MSKQKENVAIDENINWDGKYEYECRAMKIYIDDKICYKYVDDAKNQLNLLPQKTIDILTTKNWNITITKDNLAQKHYEGIYNSIQGVTLYVERKIELEDRKNAIYGALIHECGHAIDMEMDRPSLQISFANVLKEDWTGMEIICGEYKDWALNDMEAFAECFHQTYTNPKTFQEYCPNIYAYMKGLLENLENAWFINQAFFSLNNLFLFRFHINFNNRCR